MVGEIINHNEVVFIDHKLDSEASKIVNIIVKGDKRWNEGKYTSFLIDRIVSKDRRDIEKILLRLGLSRYDPIKIAERTHAINPKDLFWVAEKESSLLDGTIEKNLSNIFEFKLSVGGDTIRSPDGQNIKEYGISNGSYGIRKKRLSDVMTDAESEVGVYNISKLLGVDVCPAWFVDKDTIFSKFEYNFASEYLVHARHFFKDGERTGYQYEDLVNKFTEHKENIAKMCLLDFITRQDDRHLSNIAILISGGIERFYPLYDNGRSLFFDCGEELVGRCVNDIKMYCTTFGEIGTYYDVVKEIAKDYRIKELINLDITKEQVVKALENARFTGYRLEGSIRWVLGTLSLLRECSN